MTIMLVCVAFVYVRARLAVTRITIVAGTGVATRDVCTIRVDVAAMIICRAFIIICAHDTIAGETWLAGTLCPFASACVFDKALRRTATPCLAITNIIFRASTRK